ncbi:phosphoribosylformylglycinamidine cyclo-ligase [candidate division WOR-3 bacterium]|nr:phosphoribosylformylglycinamidine cyclo-ligase [candidate division WOR-3 bacterium]
MKYKEAGVDIEKGDTFKKYIKKLSNVIGGFGGTFEIPKGYKHPLLVSSVDSVGTKLKIAMQLGIHNTVGKDIVNHCVNDILTLGAKPLYFMDYIGTGKLNLEQQKEVINGIVDACKENDILLLGGETAELPGLYNLEEYDLVGFITGIVEKNNLIDGSKIMPGDKLIGLPSNGLHTNGYSLVRKIIKDKGLSLNLKIPELGSGLGEELLKIHRSYKDLLTPFLDKVKGLIHITGGGFYGNVPRILPKGLGAKIYKDSWDIPPIFKFIQHEGEVEEREMFEVFNMGIGMIVIVDDFEVLSGICAISTSLPDGRQAGTFGGKEKISFIGEIKRGERVEII